MIVDDLQTGAGGVNKKRSHSKREERNRKNVDDVSPLNLKPEAGKTAKIKEKTQWKSEF